MSGVGARVGVLMKANFFQIMFKTLIDVCLESVETGNGGEKEIDIGG